MFYEIIIFFSNFFNFRFFILTQENLFLLLNLSEKKLWEESLFSTNFNIFLINIFYMSVLFGPRFLI